MPSRRMRNDVPGAADDSLGFGLSTLSYNGRVHFGVVGDTKCVRDPDAIVQRYTREFKKLLPIALVEDWDDEIGAGMRLGYVGALRV